MNLYLWAEYAYYDGLLTFAQAVGRLEPKSPIRRAHIRWLNSELTLTRVRGSA